MKTLIALVLLLLLSAVDGLAAVAFVQGSGVTSGSQVASVSKSITATAGNAIVVVGTCASGNCAGAIWGDDKGNSYTVIESGGGYCNMAVATNVAAGATNITLTPTSSDYLSFGVAEFSGMNASPADGNASNTSGTAADPVSPAITTSASGVTIGGLNYLPWGQTLTATGGYSLIYGNNSFGINISYKLTTVGSQQASWTAPADFVNGWVTCVMGLKAAAVVGGRRPVAPMVLP